MQTDVLIVGGGLAGLALAVALRRSPLKITLIEATPPQPAETVSWDSRVYAISPASARFLEATGVWRHLDRSRMTRVSEMAIRGDTGAQLQFSARETGVDELAWIVESRLIQRELWESARRQSNLDLVIPARPIAMQATEDARKVELDDGRLIRTRLVVGADGVRSWVREQAGLTATTTPYGQKGVVANFECEHPHHGTAYQWFLGGSVLAWLPLPGKRLSMVWSAPDEEAEGLVALTPQALADRVAAAGGHALGSLQPLTPAAAFPLRLMRVPQIIAPRLALIGDAAHAIHPLSGHGINLGFHDARVLADCLGRVENGEDAGLSPLLRRYARQRHDEIHLLQSVSDGLHHLFAQSHPLFGLLRNAGLNLTNHLPVIKNSLVRFALNT